MINNYYLKKKCIELPQRVEMIIKNNGFCYLIKSFFKLLFGYPYYTLQKSRRVFSFRGQKYHYFYSLYQYTWANERAIEIPIVWDFVKKTRGRILEVGNVLSHYFKISHTVVDKYEKSSNVINEDIVGFCPEKRFDLIVSISTLEHVGVDDFPPCLEKIIDAIQSIKKCLKKNGLAVITLPLGQNPILDEYLDDGRISFDRQYYMKRVSEDNRWIEAKWSEVKNSKNDYPYLAANGIVIGIISKK